MPDRPTSRAFSDRPTRPEQMAHLWHELHRRDATHRSRIDPGWLYCRGCRRFSPYHRAGLTAAVEDIRARLVDSMASTNTTQGVRRTGRGRQDNWRRRGPA